MGRNMIPIAPFVLGILGIMDGISTYYVLKYQKMLFPKIAQHKGEKGFSAKRFIRKYGVKKGLICNYMFVILLAICVFLMALFSPLLDLILIVLFLGIYLTILLINNIPTIRHYQYLLKTLQNKEMKKDVDRFLDLVQQQVNLKEKIWQK
jgi:hypothetical protein